MDFDAHYQSWFYIKEDTNYAENEWLKQGDDYFYLKSGGYMAKSEWVEDKGAFYYLDQNGKMKRNAWLGALCRCIRCQGNRRMGL